MSLTSYTGLIAAVPSDWMHRSDISTSQCDDFIALFTSDFNSNVRVRQMEASTNLTSTAGYLIHPTNWLGWKSIKAGYAGITYVVPNRSDEQATDTAMDGMVGQPVKAYSLRGSTTWLYPYQSSGVACAVQYWESVPLLTGSATTNWLLTKYPGAYLYGMLIMSNMMISDPRYQEWVAAYNDIIAKIKSDDRKEQWANTSLRQSTDMVFAP